MDPLTIMLLSSAGGGLLGLLGYDQKKKEAEAQRAVETAKAKWSGFTGQQPKAVTDPNMLAEILQGGVGGLQFGGTLANTMFAAKNASDTAKVNKFQKLLDEEQKASQPILNENMGWGRTS